LGLCCLTVAGFSAGCIPLKNEPELTTLPSPELMAIELTMAAPKPPPSAAALRTTLRVPRPLPRPAQLDEPSADFVVAEPVAVITTQPLPFFETLPRVQPPPAPIDVVGLSEDATVNLLGEPLWRNWRPPSRILRYAAADCAVDIYFYLDVVTDTFQALQVRAPSKTAQAGELASCLGKVRDERRSKDLEAD